jgi:hypothetical protein
LLLYSFPAQRSPGEAAERPRRGGKTRRVTEGARSAPLGSSILIDTRRG